MSLPRPPRSPRPHLVDELSCLHRFFSSLLEADTNTYTTAGAEYCGRVYKDGNTVPDGQRIGETVAREFVINDKQQLPLPATDDDDE